MHLSYFLDFYDDILFDGLQFSVAEISAYVKQCIKRNHKFFLTHFPLQSMDNMSEIHPKYEEIRSLLVRNTNNEITYFSDQYTTIDFLFTY